MAQTYPYKNDKKLFGLRTYTCMLVNNTKKFASQEEY